MGVESERVGDASGASINIAVELELGPDSLLLGEASENPFTRVLPHASYVHKGKTSARLCAWQDDAVNSHVPLKRGSTPSISLTSGIGRRCVCVDRRARNVSRSGGLTNTTIDQDLAGF